MSKHNVQDAVEADAARMGFHKTRTGPDFHKIRWKLQCSKCPRDFTASWSGGMKPEAMARQVRVRQWDVDYGMRPLCPDCAHGKDKAPLAKPEHQNFKPYVPPRTAIFDGLLDAAVDRTRKQEVARNLDVLLEMELGIRNCNDAVKEAKAEKREARAALTEAEKLAAMQARAKHAGAMRMQRIEDRRKAQAAGAAALHRAQLKERCGTQAGPTKIDEASQVAPQAEREVMNIQPKATLSPSPKITHAVFQSLDAIFDPAKRLYRSGYTDQRVARECGTTEEVVAYLRTETFGQLAEDPRISSIRDDVELLRMESAETFAKLQKQLGEIASRIEQVARS